MTTQEFVKKESDIKYPLTTGQPAEADSWNEAFNEVFSDGLTKGLEIAKEFARWTVINTDGIENGVWSYYDSTGSHNKSIDELLTIFLTEKYGE